MGKSLKRLKVGLFDFQTLHACIMFGWMMSRKINHLSDLITLCMLITPSANDSQNCAWFELMCFTHGATMWLCAKCCLFCREVSE